MTTPVIPRSLNVTPGDADLLNLWRNSMLAQGLAATTIRLRLNTVALATRSAGRFSTTLTADDLRYWLAGHANPNTRRTYYNVIVAFYSWLVQEGYAEANPTAVMPRPRVPRGAPRPCSTLALHALMDAAPARARAMFMLAAFQGLRASEVASVRGEDLDLAAGTLRVHGKGGVTAVLPLHPTVAELAAVMPASGWWFESPKRPGNAVRPGSVTGAVRTACTAVGVRRHGAHPLRHWFGTELVRSGADLRTAQTLLRHASLATTAIYVDVSDESRRAAVLRLPGPNG